MRTLNLKRIQSQNKLNSTVGMLIAWCRSTSRNGNSYRIPNSILKCYKLNIFNRPNMHRMLYLLVKSVT